MAVIALYTLSVWLLVGMGLGLLSTGYGACRKVYRFLPGLGELLDWLWFVVAAAIFVVVAFWLNWGLFQIWSVIFVLLGYLIWSWLAAPFMLTVFSSVAWVEARFVHYLCTPAFFVAARMRKWGTKSKGNLPPKE